MKYFFPQLQTPLLVTACNRVPSLKPAMKSSYNSSSLYVSVVQDLWRVSLEFQRLVTEWQCDMRNKRSHYLSILFKKTEINHCRRCSCEIKQYFISVLFRVVRAAIVLISLLVCIVINLMTDNGRARRELVCTLFQRVTAAVVLNKCTRTQQMVSCWCNSTAGWVAVRTPPCFVTVPILNARCDFGV